VLVSATTHAGPVNHATVHPVQSKTRPWYRLRRLLQVMYAPLMLLGVNGTAIAIAASGHAAWLPLLIVVAVGLSFAVERAIPYEPDWNRSRGDGKRDLVHALVNESLNVAAVALLPLIASFFMLTDAWPTSWPFAVQVVLAVVVLDVGITLTHYASHKLPLLWRFHAVHHSVERFYGFNGLMKHPVHQLIELGVGVAPLLLISLPHDVAAAMAALVAVQLLMQHSNADYRIGWLGAWLALNQAHRFHHLRWPTLGDVNFGLFLTLWDRLLGTFTADPHKRFGSEELGIADEPDFPVAYLDQLAKPFR
jgi:sterol desaturase/sphingolipid hydroxylase (fatty acid hydroxylase superfamily)